MQTLKTKLSKLIQSIYIKHEVLAFKHGIANNTKDQLQQGEAFLKEAREAAAAIVQEELPNRSSFKLEDKNFTFSLNLVFCSSVFILKIHY